MSLVGLFLNTNQSFKMTFPTIREQRIGCAPDCGIRISYQHMQQRTQPGLPLSSFLISLQREDVAESIVAWYGHTYSAARLPTQTLNAIEDAIPARCSHLTGQNKIGTNLQSIFPGWRCFHQFLEISGKTGRKIPTKTLVGQTMR